MNLIIEIGQFFNESMDNDILFQILLATILVDFLTGIARAAKERELNSTAGINGLMRHGLVIIMTVIVSYFSVKLDADWFKYAFTAGFAIQYVLSISENWALAGYIMPPNIRDYLSKLELLDFEHDKNDENKLEKIKDSFTKKTNKESDNDE